MKTNKLLISATFGGAAMLALSGCSSSRFDVRPSLNVSPVEPLLTAPLDPVTSLPLPPLDNSGLPAGVNRVLYGGFESPGSILVDLRNHKLYHVQHNGTAHAYPIASPREGAEIPPMDNTVTMKKINPTWTPTANMRRKNSNLPAQIPGGVPENPLGVRALYLGSTLFRIHGTNEPQSIGRDASSGCIRMHNAHVIDLYDRVNVGTTVRVYRDQPVPGIGVRKQTPAYNF